MPDAQLELSAAEAIVRMAQRLPDHQTKLPGLRRLSRQLGFTVAQVRTAIGHLSRLGVLRSVHGAGTFYLGAEIPTSRLETLETAALMLPRRRSAPVFHVLCVPELVTSPVHAQMLVAIVNAFSRRNEAVQINMVPKDEWEDWAHKKRGIRGLLVAEFATPGLGKMLDRRRVPWVVLARLPEGVSADCAVLDDRVLLDLLVDHLHTLGHKRVGLIYPDVLVPSVKRRKEGFLQRCAQLSIQAHLQAHREGETPPVEALVERGCTALACNNDALALQVIREAKRLRIGVPEQLSVCGVDNIPEGIRNRPSLTTVYYSLPMMGEWAVKMLLSPRSNGTGPRRRWVVPSEVVARGSTAPPLRRARPGSHPAGLAEHAVG